MENLKPLKMKDAKDGIIKLTDVTGDNATALIPVPPHVDQDDLIEVLIAGKPVAPAVGTGDPVNDFFEVDVPKRSLLDNVGPQGAVFKYVYWSAGANEAISDPITYEIRHS